VKIVGYEVEKKPACLRLPQRKAMLLREALRHWSKSKRASTETLRALVGVWIWGALLFRDLLSIPHAIFKFIDKHPSSTPLIWPTVRRELKAMAEVIPFMEFRPGRQISNVLFGTDAMGSNEIDCGGYGIVARQVRDDLAREVFEHGTALGKTVTKLNGDLSTIKFPDRKLPRNTPFTKLPEELFDLEKWIDIEAGRWRFSDHITLGESRTVIRLLRLLSREKEAHDHVVLSLQDNQPTSGAMTKGRSTAPALNFLLRKKIARTAATGIRLLLPWVESCRQPADKASRLQ